MRSAQKALDEGRDHDRDRNQRRVSLFSYREVHADPRRSASRPSIFARPMAMRGWRRCKGLFLAAVILLALAAPAFAAPAGSEYVPKVPKAAGEEILRGKQGPGGTILSPEVRGADANTSASGEASQAQMAVTQMAVTHVMVKRGPPAPPGSGRHASRPRRLF